MTVVVLVVANAALILHTLHRLLGVARDRREAIPHWPDSLDLPIPGLPAPAIDRAAHWPVDVRIAS